MNFNARFSLQSGDDNDAVALDLFEQSMTMAEHYPTNIVYSRSYEYQLQECEEQISVKSSELFGDENIVDILDFGEDSENRGELRFCPRSIECSLTAFRTGRKMLEEQR